MAKKLNNEVARVSEAVVINGKAVEITALSAKQKNSIAKYTKDTAHKADYKGLEAVANSIPEANIIMKETNDGGLSIVKEYVYTDSKGETVRQNVTDRKAIATFDTLTAILKSSAVSTIATCAELAHVESTESYKALGFKSALDFATTFCGIKKDTARTYIRVARVFLTLKVDETGARHYGYKHPAFEGASVANMAQMLSLFTDEKSKEIVRTCDDVAAEYLDTGKVHPIATLAALKKELATLKKEIPDNAGTIKEKSGDTADSEKNEKPAEQTLPNDTKDEETDADQKRLNGAFDLIRVIAATLDDDKRTSVLEHLQAIADIINA